MRHRIVGTALHVELDADHRDLQAAVREFAQSTVRPRAAEVDQGHRFPREIIAAAAELDLMGILVPAAYGGAGLDHLAFAIVVEAGVYIVFARTGRDLGPAGVSAFIVPAESDGLKFGQPLRKMGLHGSATGELVLEEARVPATNLLFEEGRGFAVAMRALDSGRIGIAGQALGIAHAAVEEAIQHTRERRQFAGPIAEKQGVQFMLADMATRLLAARQMAYG